MTKLINSRRWRPRYLWGIRSELGKAFSLFPNLNGVVIIDDNPTNDLRYFKDILLMYSVLRKVHYNTPLGVLNIRADKITAGIAKLLSLCGCGLVILGIETVGKRAMKLLGKQISPFHVIRAKKILEKEGIRVGGSFIIGLPMDDWKTVNETIDFARDIGLSGSLWGHLLPFKGTKVRNYVYVANDHAETMVAPKNGEIIKCTGSETKELPMFWIIKAWLRANIKTNPHSLFTRWNPIPTLKMVWHCIRYAEIHTMLWYSLKFFIRWFLGGEGDPEKRRTEDK